MAASARPASTGDLTALLAVSRELFILTGAGVSTGSGIPDYRDAEGRWKQKPPISYQQFVRSEAVRRRYWARSFAGWPEVARARPNAAHFALARLEQAGRIRCLVTQNVDGLHQAAGSRAVIDLHGRLDRATCMTCAVEEPRDDLQRRLAAANPEVLARPCELRPDGDAETAGVDVATFVVAPCRVCGGVLKPGFVFFGESVPGDRVAAAFAALDQADAVLVVGSSLMVWSGYRFARAAVARGLPLAIVNRGRTRADPDATFKVEGSCAEILSAAVDSLDPAPRPASGR
jgi:NAD-dependent SIR2 family protein deacetylase